MFIQLMVFTFLYKTRLNIHGHKPYEYYKKEIGYCIVNIINSNPKS